MSLKPSLAFQRIGTPSAEHTLEIFIDFQCGRAKNLVFALDKHIVPHIKEGGKLYNKLSLIVRLAPQNWHISSSYLAEASFAVGHLNPSAYWDYSLVLFENQSSFLNVRVQDLSATQIRSQAVDLAKAFVKEDNLLDSITNKPHETLQQNGPNASTPDLQYNIKYARQLSIQHTPSVVFDGIIQGHVFDGGLVNGIPSSWGAQEWQDWVQKEVSPA